MGDTQDAFHEGKRKPYDIEFDKFACYALPNEQLGLLLILINQAQAQQRRNKSQ